MMGVKLTAHVARKVVGDLVALHLALAGQAPGLHGLVLQLAPLEGNQLPILIHAARLVHAPRPCIAFVRVPATGVKILLQHVSMSAAAWLLTFLLLWLTVQNAWICVSYYTLILHSMNGEASTGRKNGPALLPARLRGWLDVDGAPSEDSASVCGVLE